MPVPAGRKATEAALRRGGGGGRGVREWGRGVSVGVGVVPPALPEADCGLASPPIKDAGQGGSAPVLRLPPPTREARLMLSARGRAPGAPPAAADPLRRLAGGPPVKTPEAGDGDGAPARMPGKACGAPAVALPMGLPATRQLTRLAEPLAWQAEAEAPLVDRDNGP